MALAIAVTTASAENGAKESLQTKLAQATQLAMADSRDDARDLLESITNEFPDSPEAYNNLAVLAAYSEDWNGAIDLLKKALATNKSLQTSYQNLNLIYRYRAALAYRAALPDDTKEPLALPDLTMVSQPTALATFVPERTTEVTPVFDERTLRDNITLAVQTWATAWSAQDVDTYLASYADEYAPEGSADRSTWRKTRRDRILKPASIQVSLANTHVELLSDHKALVTFVQHYRSNVFSDSVRKLMVLKRTEDQWSITREHVIQ